MSTSLTIKFSSLQMPTTGSMVVFCDEANNFGPLGEKANQDDVITRSIKASDFKGKFGKTAQILAPHGSQLDRIILVGLGRTEEQDEQFWVRLGGKLSKALTDVKQVALMLEKADGSAVEASAMANVALGLQLGNYRFQKYLTVKADEPKTLEVTLCGDAASDAQTLWKDLEGVGEGVLLARTLVNEPANVLTPVDFAQRAEKLQELGCDVEVLDKKAMKKLKMDALLGVSLGSRNAPRMAIIQWNGGKKGEQPIAFVGKGVTFDTGGISIKPAGGMEDMKGDMGGAAAVTGLMHALASRKAKANVVGVIALVENMPDGKAQRPGDIVTSMSGQTIEVINTDAEGRLILADALWHCQETFKPKFMINLATLTGAVLIALGKEYAGMFSNDDALCEKIAAAGQATQEKVWRFPLGAEYDKMIDSKFADMKNTGGRLAGSITAGQFLQRFVNDVPWAHLDVAGTAMASPESDINKSWGSGFGVRLLDRLVADHFEQ